MDKDSKKLQEAQAYLYEQIANADELLLHLIHRNANNLRMNLGKVSIKDDTTTLSTKDYTSMLEFIKTVSTRDALKGLDEHVKSSYLDPLTIYKEVLAKMK